MLVNSMDEGYILSNKFRKAVFEGFVSGETDIKIISKKHRIIPRVAEKIFKEFIENDIITKKDNRYILTKKGERIAEYIKE